MADSKITALAALTTADPANDMFPVVDVSDTSMAASGTTKRISINNILACSPSATLASATITGDLTVDTSTLKVDSTNNRVGIKQASPSHPFQIGTTDLISDASANLGIGVTPSAWDSANYKALQVSRTSVASLSNIGIFASNWFADTGGDKYIATATAARIDVNNAGGIQFKLAPSGTAGNAITFTQAMTLDASGNLLLGTVTAPTGTKIGSIAKLGYVSLEGTGAISVSTTPVALARIIGTGGLFFVTGYNTSGGAQGWWLVASTGGGTPTVIASGNNTGLTVAFTTVVGIVYMNTVSGTIEVTSFAITNQL